MEMKPVSLHQETSARHRLQRRLADKVRRGTFTDKELKQYKDITKCGGWLKQETEEEWKARLGRDRQKQKSKPDEEKAALSRKRKVCQDSRRPEEKDLRRQISTLQQQLRRCQYVREDSRRTDYSKIDREQRWAEMEEERGKTVSDEDEAPETNRWQSQSH